MAKKAKYGLIDLLMDRYDIEYTAYDISVKTGVPVSTFYSANEKGFDTYTIRVLKALSTYCNADLGQLVNDLDEIDQIFYQNLDSLKQDLEKNHDQGSTYQELKEILPKIVKNVANTEIESEAYMSHLNKFIKQFKN